MKLGSIEAGGTKFVCAIGNEKYEVLERIEIPTTTPAETMSTVIGFFRNHHVDALGIGTFGPVELNETKKDFGTILKTPKIAWEGFSFLKALEMFDIPIAITTDVNASAYGEYIYDESINSCTYFTIGTGVGGGYVHNGEIINGRHHPEMGHMSIRKHPFDTFEGGCAFHKDCLEGLASGPTIEARTKIKGQELKEAHPVFDYIAYYIAQAAYNVSLIQAPERIILGGGVMEKPQLIDKVRIEYNKLMNSYIDTGDLEALIITPKLKNNAATVGCFALAKKELEQNKNLKKIK